MRITEQQEAYLNSLTCQRLTDDPINKQLIKNFRCARNTGLAGQLRYLAWEEDLSGSTTYYIIKDQEGRILLYFSLQCGSLFDPIDREQLMEDIQRYRQLQEMIRTRHRGATKDKYLAQLQQLQREYNMPLYMLDHEFERRVNQKKGKIKDLDRDIAKEVNPHISRVFRTYPAVELVHFVSNDNGKAAWRKQNMGHSMGEVLFWYFICPIMTGIHKSLGCQYAYLFAADNSVDQNLVNYYKVRLNFQQSDELAKVSTTVPVSRVESPGSSTLTLRIIWRMMTSMCLSLISTPC